MVGWAGFPVLTGAVCKLIPVSFSTNRLMEFVFMRCSGKLKLYLLLLYTIYLLFLPLLISYNSNLVVVLHSLCSTLDMCCHLMEVIE